MKVIYLFIRWFLLFRDEISNKDSLQFALEEIETATNIFSDNNKIWEGGFVKFTRSKLYCGILLNCVLHISSTHSITPPYFQGTLRLGIEQFKNEAILVGKIYHKNLVRLLGFCLEGEAKNLIYEFVTNRNLDYFVFGMVNRCYKIIAGISRGILYLQEDSRLKIIHRDLKASNILLDHEMNSKITDFGMAKIFVVGQTQGSTNRIVRTGCMSPEYAMHRQLSVKLDVFSFGVLVLEILSGKKNNFFYQSRGGAEDLLSY
ncbi:Serine/threonine protein kinase, partial [Parasponia andersonii]